MEKRKYFSELMRYVLWTFFDYVVKIILISIIWFIFNLPFLYTVYVLIYTKIPFSIPYIILLVLILYSPISFGAGYFILQIISQIINAPQFLVPEKVVSNDFIKLSLFFKGMKHYFIQSIFTMITVSLISIILFMSLKYYYTILIPKIPILGIILTGLILWFTIIFYLMNTYLLPVLLTKKIHIFKALYQSFLLVIDNLVYSLLVSLLISSFFIIMGFTMAGIFVIFFGTASLIQILSYFIIYQKYDETIQFIQETRTLKNIIKM